MEGGGGVVGGINMKRKRFRKNRPQRAIDQRSQTVMLSLKSISSASLDRLANRSE